MKNLMKLLPISLLISTSTVNLFASNDYSSTDLEKYNNTRECISCDLSKTSLAEGSNSDMSYSILDGANLSETILQGNFANSSFKNTILTRATNYFYGYNKLLFTGSDFSNTNMSSVTFKNVDFSSSNFTSVRFINADLKNSNFSNCSFTNAVFNQANLNNANFSGSDITEEQLKQAKNICDVVLPSGDILECK